MTHGVTLELDEFLSLRATTTQLTLPKAQHPRALLAGNYLSAFRGRGMEFNEIRPYQPGDDVRTIDWRVTARTQQTYTKLFREERERPVYLFIDQSATMKFGTRTAFKSIVAARIAAMLAWTTISAGDRIGAVIFDDERHSEIKPMRGQRGVINLAKTLIGYCNTLHYARQATTPAWQTALNRAQYFVHPGSHLIFIGDFRQPNETNEKQFSLLKRHNDISLIYVYDVLEKHAPPAGRYTVSDGAQFHTLAFGQRDKQAMQSEHVAKTTQFLSTLARQYAIHTLQIATDMRLEETLFDVFRPRGRS